MGRDAKDGNNASSAASAESCFKSCATLLRLRSVLQRTTLSRSEVYRRIGAKTFPAPVRIGVRARAFDASEIEAWIADRVSERDAGKVP